MCILFPLSSLKCWFCFFIAGGQVNQGSLRVHTFNRSKYSYYVEVLVELPNVLN